MPVTERRVAALHEQCGFQKVQLSRGWISLRLIDDKRYTHKHTSFHACTLGYSHFTSNATAIGRKGRNIIFILASKMARSRICSLNGLMVTVFPNATINIQTNNSISRGQFLQTEMSGRGGLIPQSVKDRILMHRLMKEPQCFNSPSSCHQTLICPQGIQF